MIGGYIVRKLFQRYSIASYQQLVCLSTFTNSVPFDFVSSDFKVDEQYYRNVVHHQQILHNLRLRDATNEFGSLFRDGISSDELSEELIRVSARLPNTIHSVWNDKICDLDVVESVGQPKKFNFKPQRAEQILLKLGLAQFADLKSGKLGMTGGKRSYIYQGKLTKLSRVLARWTLNKLVNEYNFTPVVTPNLIHADLIRACGFEPHGPRTQVYSFTESPNVCLAGTAEMPLASFHLGENLISDQELPKRYCALSRCYRAEAKSAGEMSGLYRVHYFDKVEMFSLCHSTNGASDLVLNEFVSIQRKLFSELGLHFRIVDMPPHELGSPAHRKFDIEAYMPGRGDYWGEISSASNCTDYQAKRLNITYNKFYLDDRNHQDIMDVDRLYVHTINGTACAIPRMIIAIVEQNQTADGRVELPEVLRPLMDCEMLD